MTKKAKSTESENTAEAENSGPTQAEQVIANFAQASLDSDGPAEVALTPTGVKRNIANPKSDSKMDAIVSIESEDDLAVPVKGTATVFRLAAGVPRDLPKRLGLAAQLAGAEKGISVQIGKPVKK